MIEVRVRYQHEIEGWEVADTQSGIAQALQKEQPGGEIRVHYERSPADLYEEG